MMRRHAYCIIAHTDPGCLRTLLELVDDERNDVYLLMDMTSDRAAFGALRTQRARLRELPADIDIRWGDISLVEAELALFEAVVKAGVDYEVVHLLSGSDLPVKSQDRIYEICSALPAGANMVGFARGTRHQKDLRYKTRYRHFLNRYYKTPNKLLRAGVKTVRTLAIVGQQCLGLLGIRRRWRGYTLAKGSQWASMRLDFVKYLVENRDRILRDFKRVHCADEIYKQTMLLSSLFAATRYQGADEQEECLRAIDWERGDPYVWHAADCEALLHSNAIFARKFSSSVDRAAIEKIKSLLLGLPASAKDGYNA